MKYLFAVLGLSLAVAFASVSQADAAMKVPPAPANGWYVLDQTNTLTSEEIEKLNKEIESHRTVANVQFGVLMVSKIEDGEYLERFSLNVAREWGIGEKGKNNGALLLIAKDDRRMRIEVGTGLEGDLTDSRAARIIDQRIAPEFRNGKYYAGIESGLRGMVLAVEKRDDVQLANDDSGDGWLETLLNIGGGILIFGGTGIIWLGAILGRTKRWWPGGILGAALGALVSALFLSGLWVLLIAIASMLVGLFFDFSVSKNFQKAKKSGHTPSWWAGGTTLGGGGGFSGGGGFGGGSFGGGGASGSW